MINDNNQFIGQVCHIEGAMPGGERYNPNQSDEERRSYDNLMIMCYPHHVETSDFQEYSVEKLKKFKYEHESKFEKSDFKINEAALFKIMEDMERYWERIERLNTLEHSMAELAFNINVKGTFLNIAQACRANISYLQTFFDDLRISDKKVQEDFIMLLAMKGIDSKIFDDIPYYENPFQYRNWELHNLGVPNRMQRLNIDLIHMEIKYIEEYLKTNSKDHEVRRRLEHLKESFANLAEHAIVVD